MDDSVIRHTNSVAADQDQEQVPSLGPPPGDLESVVECPVCLVIPRDLPIPCCPAGHIICKSCRNRVLHCPTCRRQLGDNTSSLAAALVERVKHKCQFSEFGCQFREYLCHLVRHEEACPERTISCPPPNGCLERVQLREYHRHAVKQGCSVEMRDNQRTKFNLSKGWLQWDGVSQRIGEEFNLTEDLAWTFFHFPRHQHQFYLSAQYFAAEQLFLFYVMVWGGPEVAEDFTASISIANEESSVKMNFQGPVLSADRVPASERKLMMSPSCWIVHYRGMRSLLGVTEVGDSRQAAWSVDFTTQVEVANCMAIR